MIWDCVSSEGCGQDFGICFEIRFVSGERLGSCVIHAGILCSKTCTRVLYSSYMILSQSVLQINWVPSNRPGPKKAPKEVDLLY